MAKKKLGTIEWRERLIEIRQMKSGELRDNENNSKIHTDAQKEPLAGLLSEIGKVDILKAYHSERTGALTLWDGHCRRELRPDEVWNVGIYDLTDAEADLLLATFDPIGWQAEQSRQKIEALMAGIRSGNETLTAFLEDQQQRLGLVPSNIEMDEISIGPGGNGTLTENVGQEQRIMILVPPVEYQDARRAVLALIENNRTWDVRFPK